MRAIFLNNIVPRDYYTILKPGILYGNVITIIAGFILASNGRVLDWRLLLVTVLGLSFVMAGGCVFNNYHDRGIDALMERTKSRVLVRKAISIRSAIMYGAVLSLLGFTLLAFYTNKVTVMVALFGFFVYAVLYTLWLKRTSVHSTFVGALSGAVPPVIGYVAVRGEIDLVATVLFLILVTWQIPHAFAIALYRLSV